MLVMVILLYKSGLGIFVSPLGARLAAFLARLLVNIGKNRTNIWFWAISKCLICKQVRISPGIYWWWSQTRDTCLSRVWHVFFSFWYSLDNFWPDYDKFRHPGHTVVPPDILWGGQRWTKDYVAINLKYTRVIEDFNRRPSRVGEVLRSETFFVTGSNIQVTQRCP